MEEPARRPSGSASNFSARCRSTIGIRETSDGGTPITVAEPDNPHALVFRRMAARIWNKVAGVGAQRHPPPRR